MVNLPKKQTRIKTSLPYCLYKVDTRFFKIGDASNTKIRFTKEETTPNRRTQASKNMESIRDRWGVEAHSDVEIYTDKSFEDLSEAEVFSLQVINDFIKIYRYHDNEAVHLTPLIREDFFGFGLINVDGDGSFGIALAGGFQTSDPMRIQRVSDAIDKTLVNKETIPLWTELFLNADQYLYQGDFRHSILEGVIALEVVLSEFISKACVAKGVSSDEAKNYIKDVGLTGSIKISLRLLLDSSIVLEDDMLDKCKGGITIRNKIVHEGRRSVTRKEAEETLTNAKKLIEILLPIIANM